MELNCISLVYIAVVGLISVVKCTLPNDTDCGVSFYPPHPVKRIVGGKEVLANSWPWMAALKFDGVLTCGGTLVKDNNGTIVVLTAAQCVDGTLADPTRWEVRLGFHSRSSAEFEPYFEKFGVLKIIQHENYMPNTIQNDVAIMVLDGDVQINEGVRPACVSHEIYTPGENCVSLGWGTTVQGGTVSDRLNEVYKPLQNSSQCIRYLGGLFDPLTMLCAGFDSGGAGPCFRDSGGPLLCKRNSKWYLTGIISWGYGCGQPQAPPVYTNIFEYVVSGWLRDNADI